jgi:N-terminal half of MaoC dehydratase
MAREASAAGFAERNSVVADSGRDQFDRETSAREDERMSASRFPIEYGQVLVFTQAIGDANPVYHDLPFANTLGLPSTAAPPTFVQAAAHFDPTYPLRPSPTEPWFGSAGGPGRDDDRHSANLLYAEQHYEYARPLVVGDVLTATERPGATWEKVGRRGGALHFFETITEFRDAKGHLVVTSRVVGVSTANKPEV